ncbi:hypothetical protein B5S33_g1284 [[Candida] boidinii]|nr:hypothetical protein B5S30_g1700 [[Candida] boidinii]OWB82656.1 hypothetical protein B5S33_g1284 [[Candida] boidinii]GMF51464.1 unnamed protein product [[Candida] boidinii]GMF98111.1 unnamed protein product [[Candida] boidinii]
MTIRKATHAGSWYSSSPARLNSQLSKFLNEAPNELIKGARILVGPHAGFDYSGPMLARTYKAFDSKNIKRIFIMGPSHHVYYKNNVMLTGFDSYATPFGDIPVDKSTIKELVKLDKSMFKIMDEEMDEDEHSFEMHMPFLYKVTESLQNGSPMIIPIMISHTDELFEKKLADYLKPYFEDKENAFIISTDFCHWGSRFRYTKYTQNGKLSNLTSLNSYEGISNTSSSLKIHESIELLDKRGMEIASTGSYSQFKSYINKTKNTICGEKPLSVLISIMEPYYPNDSDGRFKWLGYSQSNKIMYNPKDSSVSYASGYAVL